jgi:hypothetical protein
MSSFGEAIMSMGSAAGARPEHMRPRGLTMSKRLAPVIGFLLGIGLAFALAAPAHAQDWRTVTSARQFAGESVLEVDVEYGAGKMNIAPGAKGSLYKSTLRYDAEAFRPVTTYSSGHLKIGSGDMRKVRGGGHGKSHMMNRLDLALTQETPLDLELKFGAVEAQIELGGLRIRSAEISTGASETTVRVSKPNTERCSLFKLNVGAAEFSAIGLGNTNAERFEFSGAAGEIMLDFSGDWRGGDMDAEIEMGLGELTLRVPRSLGLRVEKSSMLVSFETADMTKSGNTYTSNNWNTAKQKLTIELDAALGSVVVEWL